MTPLPAWAKAHFPTTHHQAVGWHPCIAHVALHPRVLCVAITRMEGTWTAYVRDVPGRDHSREANDVLAHGNTLSLAVAEAVFPDWKGIPYGSTRG